MLITKGRTLAPANLDLSRTMLPFPEVTVKVISVFLNIDCTKNIAIIVVSDIDECALGICGVYSDCTNLVASYECECQSGFKSPSGSNEDCIGWNCCEIPAQFLRLDANECLPVPNASNNFRHKRMLG